MQPPFSSQEVEYLFEYALENRRSDAAGLALKAATVTNADSCALLSKAIEKSKLLQMSLANGLTHFARYDQLDLVINLLKGNSSKIKLTAILTLQLLKDPLALDQLKKESIESSDSMLRERASLAFTKIAEEPVKLADNSFYTPKQLGNLEEIDLALADFIFNRPFSEKSVSVLIKLLYNSVPEIKTLAKNALVEKTKSNSNEIIDIIVAQDLPLLPETISVLGNCKDSRAAHLIVGWLKRTNKNYSSDNDAIEALGKIGGEEAASYLAEAITKEGYHDAEFDALKKIGQPPIAYLVSQYKSNDYFRRKGAEKLATILGVHSLPSLLEALQDRYSEIRYSAEAGLIKLGKISVEPLVALLNTASADVQINVCKTLGQIGDKTALPVLNTQAQSPNKNLHWVAIEAIGRIHNPASVSILSRWLEHSDDKTRKISMTGLSEQDNIEACELLIDHLNSKGTVQRLKIIRWLNDMARRVENARTKIAKTFLQLICDDDLSVANLVKTNLIELGIQYDVVFEEIKKAKQTEHTSSLVSIIYERKRKRRDNDLLVAKYEANISASRDMMFQSDPAPTLEIPQPISDIVQLAVSAPQVVAPGRSFLLDVWAYFNSFRSDVYTLARRAQRNKDISMRFKGPIKIKRDSTLTIKLNISDFDVEDTDTIYWGGTTGNCSFPIKVPDKTEFGFYLGTANFYVGPLLIAKLHFDIQVGIEQEKQSDITTREERISTAFASYSSDDRNKVLGRIQGMQKLVPDLDIFLDVASLRSGQDWELRLETEIDARDIFYLFWSEAASKSTWVEKEWRTALLKKGLEYIEPVPLEPPHKAPPPQELSSLHFNEWTLTFEKES